MITDRVNLNLWDIFIRTINVNWFELIHFFYTEKLAIWTELSQLHIRANLNRAIESHNKLIKIKIIIIEKQ